MGLNKITRELYDETPPNSDNLHIYALSHMNALISEKRYLDANAFADSYAEANLVEMNSIFRTSLTILRIIAYTGAGDERMRDFYLGELKDMKTLRPIAILHLTNELIELGRGYAAKDILEEAHQAYPYHQLILTNLIKVELDSQGSASVGVHLKNLLKMKRPERSLLKKAYQHLTSDYFIFTTEQDELIIQIEGLLNEA